MYVIKRDGTKEEFNADKIYSAIESAFEASGDTPKKDSINQIIEHIEVWDNITVEEIQDIVIEVLRDYGYEEVASLYETYKNKQSVIRQCIDKIDFMQNYINSSENAATMSNTDPNANTSAKNVATLEPEVFKDKFRDIQRYMMKKQLKHQFPEVSRQYEKDLNHHIIYTHDEASTPTIKQYCMAVSLYPLMLHGCGVLDKTTPYAPNDLQSFSGQLVNSIFALSAQCKGAVACIHGSQKLIINNESITIKEFVNNNWANYNRYEDWEYVDVSNKGYNVLEDGKYVPVKKIFRKKYSDKILTISSNSGLSVKVSKNHKFKVFEKATIKEVEAKDLKIFDTVFVNHEIPIDYTSKEYKEGWIKGMLLGDGCLTQLDMVQLSINYDQEYYADIFNEYCQSLYGESLYQCAGHKCWQYETHKRDFSAKLREGITGTDAFDKNIIQTSSVPYLIGVLDGLLCADGEDYNSIGISLVNKDLISTVKSILDILNIQYSYREIPEHDNKSRLYHLNISSKVLNFTPNLLLKMKNKRYNFIHYHSGYANTRNRKDPKYIISNTKGHYKYPFYKTDVITSITEEDNDDAYVYEIETESHWYNCGGFITHNCGSYFIVLNYYIIADYGPEWYKKLDVIVTSEHVINKRTLRNMIEKSFKTFVCGINQPAGNRGFQSPFTNISYYDHTYFTSLFDSFYYPDGTQPTWEAIDALQRLFMNWFNQWRLKQIVAFPVETFAMVCNKEHTDIIDKSYKELCAEMYSKGHSFFTYISDSADSLASCCRLRNELAENTFNPTSGLTGIKTGSCNVITLNINRIIQDYFGPCKHEEVLTRQYWNDSVHREEFKKYLVTILERVYKYHIAYKTMLYDWENKGAYASSTGDFIHIRDLYSTIGINGLNEGARFLGLEVSNNPEYISFLQFILGTIKEQNKLHSIKDKKYPVLFNSECVPAEGLGVKNYNWDKADGYWVPNDVNLYNSYFYEAHDDTSVLDKFILHGRQTASYCDGGSAAHINLQEHLSKRQYLELIDFAVEQGTNYFTFNIPNSQCNDCHYITKIPITKCPKCGGEHITQYTRIIGYLRPISAFAEARRIEALDRTYSKTIN